MSSPEKSNGGRNLIIMSSVCIFLAFASTSISLFIYRKTGDIYLDRSRPGFIGEDEGYNNEDDGDEEFDDTGSINNEVINEYLEKYDEVYERIEKSRDAFDEKALSDESLGIKSIEKETE